jgi:hypothetical protein
MLYCGMSCTYGISIEKDDNGGADEGNVAYKVRLAKDGSALSWKFMDADGGSLSTGSFAQYENINEVNRHPFQGPACLADQSPSCQMGWLINHVPEVFNVARNLQSDDRINFVDKHATHRWTGAEWKKKQGAAIADSETLEQWDQMQQDTPTSTIPTPSTPRL